MQNHFIKQYINGPWKIKILNEFLLQKSINGY